MIHPLHDSRLKLNRAHDHLNALNAEFEAFVARKPYRVVGHYDAESGDYVVRARVFEQPPPAWGTTLGDFLQNARASLDFLAYQLVLVNNRQPTRRNQFPLFPTPEDFASKATGQTEGMSERHIQMIETCQPYAGSSPFAPLRALTELSNSDKHHVLVLRTFSLRSFGFRLIDRNTGMNIPTSGERWSFAGAWKALEDGAEIMRIPLPAPPEPQVYMDANHSVVVGLSEGSYVPDILGDIYQAVEDVFDLFVDEFPPAL